MNYQRGGPVNGWLLAALIALAFVSAGMNVYQYWHRQIVLNITMPDEPKPPSSTVDARPRIHPPALNPGQPCTAFNNVCPKDI
jgi:hypothetical protein